jgi:nitroreductase
MERVEPSSRSAALPEQAEAVVSVAVSAPSLHNTQPWHFRVRGDALELRADRSRQLAASDPTGRQLVVSCGAALLGARLAVRHLGAEPRVRLLPDPAEPDLLAELRAGKALPPDDDGQRLLEAMSLRRSYRGRFEGPPVPPPLIFRLQTAAEQEGCRLVLVHRPGARRAIADLVAVGERAQQSDPGRREELEAWTPAVLAGRRDGIPPTAYPARPAPAGPQELTARDFAAGREQGARGVAALPTATAAPPLVAVLMTEADDPAAWLSAGQALHRLLLEAAAAGVQASLHGQPTELDGLRRLLADELLVDAHPQMLLQLGTVSPQALPPPTPRRPVSEVLEQVTRAARGTPAPLPAR